MHLISSSNPDSLVKKASYLRIVARELGISPAELEPATSRVPMRPIEMHIFANEAKEGEDYED